MACCCLVASFYSGTLDAWVNFQHFIIYQVPATACQRLILSKVQHRFQLNVVPLGPDLPHVINKSYLVCRKSYVALCYTDGSNSLLERVLSKQADTIRQVLGRPIQECKQQPSHAVVIARSAETIGSQEASCSFEVILTQPTFRLDTEALCQVSCG